MIKMVIFKTPLKNVYVLQLPTLNHILITLVQIPFFIIINSCISQIMWFGR